MIALLLLFLLWPFTLNAQVIVSWNYAAGQEVQEDGFEVERAPATVDDWQVIAINPANIMSIEDIDVPGNRYRARAFIGAEYFPYSNIGSVPPAEPTPTPPPPCRQRGKSGKCK